MIKIYTIAVLCLSAVSFAQEGPFSAEYRFNPDNVDCLPEQSRSAIKQRLAGTVAELKSQGRLSSQMPQGAHILFDWPVVKNPGTTYNNVWSISNHVDHNAAFPNALSDYMCGTRTYDTGAGYNHKGVDIFTWPFTWYQMQNNQSWAVAAADGVIIGKDNGNADQSCTFNSNQWNAVYVLHEDGSVSWYGHLKNNSLTPKVVGDAVSSGEYLGVIGSSGNSTGPHLHFEVYDAQDNLVDPYAGSCNTWNDSWWETQKPYLDPKINAVYTHSALPIFPNCPQVETPFFKDEFNVGEAVYAMGYFSDQAVGASVTINLYRPDSTLAYTSSAVSNNLWYSSYWYWIFGTTQLNQTGIWTLSFTFAGQTVSHQFAYGTSLGAEAFEADRQLAFYPNPANDRITFNRAISNVQAITADGKRVELSVSGETADISGLPTGLYMLRATSEEKQTILKLVKH
ncbi:peptidoglycan DD-metalloendopeptidase family protein [Flavobacterium selenitireducens]|uniref:peptidoglycan DD-metalloendopeptidase family protein n=1 Tax=Flavobacterium selenitireducens TaxID=2722704 RepID=UPI00168A5B5C|nr:peptidoglycan DD-metalloendopeptidase family protein [Flavobacterium selenitireducens]MBD3582497.1 peptidoglycan DD-metalloendopeptidase family protein [Flavobacterium selenitireducens]